MKISPLNYNTNNYYPLKKQTAPVFSGHLKNIFSLPKKPDIKADIQLKQGREKEFFEEFLNRSSKVTLEEYEDIAKNHPAVLALAYKMVEENRFDKDKNIELYSTPKDIATSALALKKHFDKEWGNYRIISIGTSPAIISETMENLGCEVLYMPISSLGSFSEPKKTFLNTYEPSLRSKYPNIDKSIAYLRRQGLNFDDEDKKTILLDYCYRWRTINNVATFLSNDFNIPFGEFERCSVIHCLKKLGFNTKCIINLQADMYNKEMERISNVPHFDINDGKNLKYRQGAISSQHKTKKQLFREFDTYSTPLARAFSLCVLNEIQKEK